jgi:tetratricopeptide (TPR) repeat protein
MNREIEFSDEFKARVRSWSRGEISWAEVEGFTSHEAQEARKTACDLAGRGQLRKSAGIFEGLLAINPKDHTSRAALGTVYQKMGRVDDALSAYDGAIATDAHNVVALANRGELRLKSGDLRGGLEDLAHAVDADPDGHSASARRARAIATALVQEAARAHAVQANP